MTRAAVGQQVRSLEKHLNAKLVRKSGRGIELTHQGWRLAEKLEAGFLAIREGVDQVTGSQDQNPVRLTMSPAFAVEWLFPRLPEFERANPDVKLHLNPTAELVSLRPGGTDIAVRYYDISRAGAGAATVLVTDMVVIAAPSLLNGKVIENPRMLAAFPWLQELGTGEVIDWFRRRGIPQPGPLKITEMPGNMIMQAVRRGDGISYTARAFFQDDIEQGRMQVLHSEPSVGYYCVEVGQAAQRPAVGRLLSWILSKSENVTEVGP